LSSAWAWRSRDERKTHDDDGSTEHERITTMPITAGHFYSGLSAAASILLCTDATAFEFLQLPDGTAQKFSADPTGALTDLQELGLSAGVLPVCSMDGENFQVMEAYSSDATPANTEVVMVRPQAQSVLRNPTFQCVPVQNVKPVITSVAPNTGPAAGGTKVIITGKGFRAMQSSSAAVKFGTTAAAAFTVDSDTQITVPHAPAHAAGAVDITLDAVFCISDVVAADHFTYT
jgi:hypothetical protein